MKTSTPLRYPGGKTKFFPFFKDIIKNNNINNGTYIEPFAGGAGAAIELLLTENVINIILNDADYHIYAFWKSVIQSGEEFINKIYNTSITISEWKKQKEIYNNYKKYSDLDIGFSTFFLNRTNRSGILTAGPIGGYEQKGNYKINCRFKKEKLIKKIKLISSYKNRIHVYNDDAYIFLSKTIKKYCPSNTLLYIDPPYFIKGHQLYLNHYKPKDHIKLYESIKYLKHKWVVSYDKCNEIQEIYSNHKTIDIDLTYFVYKAKKGNESIYYSDNLSLPEKIKNYKSLKLNTPKSTPDIF